MAVAQQDRVSLCEGESSGSSPDSHSKFKKFIKTINNKKVKIPLSTEEILMNTIIDYETFLYRRYNKLSQNQYLDQKMINPAGTAFRQYVASVARSILSESQRYHEQLTHISLWDDDEHWCTIWQKIDWQKYEETIDMIRRGYENSKQFGGTFAKIVAN